MLSDKPFTKENLDQKKNGNPLTLDMIQRAVCDLYGSYESLSGDIRKFLENAIEDGDYEKLYSRVRQYEAENKDNLLEYQNEKPSAISVDNVNDVIEALRRKKNQSQ